MTWRRNLATLALVLAAATLAGQLARTAQPAPAAGDGSRFEFEIVESLDAAYLGDTPAHIGRGGGLGKAAPDLALGDPVYHDQVKIGIVSRLVWDRAKASLQVEIDPLEPPDRARVPVGWTVWVPIGGTPARK